MCKCQICTYTYLFVCVCLDMGVRQQPGVCPPLGGHDSARVMAKDANANTQSADCPCLTSDRFFACKCPVTNSISISGLVVEYIVAIDVTRARFLADANSMLHMWGLQHQMAYDRDAQSTEIWRSTKARPLMWTHMCTHMRTHCPAHACQHKHTQTQTHTHTDIHTHTNTHQTPRHYSIVCFCFFYKVKS